MSPILIFGLSGQVGDALLPLLRGSACHVTALSRQKKNREQNIVWQEAGFSDFEANDKYFDAIISLGPLDAFSRWFASSNVKTKQIIALSSTSIVTKRNSPDVNERKLAQILMQGEQRLADHAQRVSASLVILRPTLIYGAGRDQSLSRWLGMAKRFGFVVLPHKADGLRQPVHIADIADAILSALLLRGGDSLTLDLPGGETLAFDNMLLRSLKAHLPATKVLRLPNFLFRLLFRFASFFGFGVGLGPGFFARLTEDLVFDATVATVALDYRPRPFSP
ncbi:MAG: SDR family oxidoreductase [Arenimonas sp.]